MVLPSIEDVLVVVVLLVPGFVSFFILRRISAVGRKFEDLETTVWSIFLSLVTYIPFSLSTGISNLDTLRDQVFVPTNFALLILYATAIGYASGRLLKHYRKNMFLGNAWTRTVGKEDCGWVVVTTDTGLEYKGWVHCVNVEEEGDEELSIGDPLLILRNKDTLEVTQEIPMGKEMLFTEKDVRRIMLLEN